MRIIIICIHLAPYEVTLILELSLLILFGGMIMIFRPFQRNINTFVEFFIFLFLSSLNLSAIFLRNNYDTVLVLGFAAGFDEFVFGIVLFGYFIYWVIKQSIFQGCCCCCKINKQNNLHNDTESTLVLKLDDQIADRIDNPGDYNERHISLAPYENTRYPQEPDGSPMTIENGTNGLSKIGTLGETIPLTAGERLYGGTDEIDYN